jgi:hypothetical protein
MENPLDWDMIGHIDNPVPKYSEFGFHDFEREWKDRILPWYTFRDNWNSAAQISDIAPFLRSWLFFGLLKEVLGQDLGSVQLLRTDGRIDKSKVVAQIEKWRLRELGTPDGRASRLTRVQLVLTEARSLVTEICAASGPNEGPSAPPSQQDIPVALMVLGEMLTSYTTRILAELKESRIRGWHIDGNRGWSQTTLVLRNIQERWSPETARMLKGSLSGHASAQLYALRLTGSAPPPAQESSVGWDGSLNVYRKAHSDNCGLKDKDEEVLVGPDGDRLAEVIEAEKIPLIRYRPSSKDVELLEFRPGIRYAIISHVWADGYGNPDENKLNRCVVEFFNQLFLDAQYLLHRKVPDPALPFWIDTLTIPVNKPAQRKKAIKTMHRAYINADFVVVVDSSLGRTGAGGSYTETAMKILASPWMGRLWTLQEAYLSRKLVFRFKDNELIDVDQLEGNFLASQTLADTLVAGQARQYFDRLLGWQRQKRIHGVPLHDDANSLLLASVWEAVQWRTTSHAVHETQALATLFEVEVDFPDDFDHSVCGSRCGEEEHSAAGGEGGGGGGGREDLDSSRRRGCRDNLDRRMSKFLESLYDAYPNSIPPGIIFVPGRRLSVESFGWAPATWMVGQGDVGHGDPIFKKPSGGAAELSLNGLLVRYPGFLLRSSRNRMCDLTENKFAFPCDIMLLEWYCVQPVEDLDSSDVSDPNSTSTSPGPGPNSSPTTPSLNRSQSVELIPRKDGDSHGLAIISSREEVREDRAIALLVWVKKARRPKLYVEVLQRVWIWRERDQTRIRGLRRAFWERRVDVCEYGEMLGPDQQWCIGRHRWDAVVAAKGPDEGVRSKSSFSVLS